jgi:hypothetical protein
LDITHEVVLLFPAVQKNGDLAILPAGTILARPESTRASRAVGDP